MLRWNLSRCHKSLDTVLGMATRCMLIRRGQKGVQSMPGTRPWRTYSRGASWRLLFKYVHWLYILSACIYMYSHFMIRLFDYSVFYYLLLPFLHLGDWFVILIGAYFCRLKINHDVHDFILDSGIVANINSLQQTNMGSQSSLLWTRGDISDFLFSPLLAASFSTKICDSPHQYY